MKSFLLTVFSVLYVSSFANVPTNNQMIIDHTENSERTVDFIPDPQTAVLTFYDEIHCEGKREDNISKFGECVVFDEGDDDLSYERYSCNKFGDLIVEFFDDAKCTKARDNDRYRRGTNGRCWGEAYNGKYFSMSWTC